MKQNIVRHLVKLSCSVHPSSSNWARSLLIQQRFCHARVAPANSLISWEPHVPVKLRMEDSKPGNYPPILVQTMMKDTARNYPDYTAMAIKRGGQWQKWTYSQYHKDVRNAAKGFLTLGLERFHGVGIMGANCPEWFIASLASIFGGGLSCGIYVTNSPSVVTYMVKNSKMDVLVIEEALLRKSLDGRSFEEAFPGLKKVVVMDSDGGEFRGMEKVMSWKGLMEIGAAESDARLEKAEQDQTVNTACLLVYTSGTTGLPKGAMLSHDNLAWTTRIGGEHSRYGQEIVMCYLPLSHTAALMYDCYMCLYNAGTVYFADNDALKGTLVDNLKEIRPTRFLAVPRVWEKIQEKMLETAAQQSSPVKKAISNWAKAAASEQHQAVRDGRRKTESISYKLAKRLVFSRIREALGLDRAVTLYTGSAPLSLNTMLYFESLDMVLQEIFGSTECSGPQTINLVETMRRGTVGQPYFGLNNAILTPDEQGQGEIIASSRNVIMGYQGEEAKTRAAFTEKGWYRSGDLGRMDEDGYLILTGRMKELIITAGGENVPPAVVEEVIKDELKDVISYAILVGEKRKHLTCLLTLAVEVDPKTLQPTNILRQSVRTWAKDVLKEKVKLETVEDFVSGPASQKLHAAIQASMEVVNKKAISNAQTVKKFTILPREFSMQGGELTPTLKIKRFYIYDKYKKEIDEMYAS